MVLREGLEPFSLEPLAVDNESVSENTPSEGTVKGTHLPDITCPILAKVVSRWGELSEDTKLAIGAIVENIL